MIYFDNAATTFPKPLCVKNAVEQAMLCYGANPGRSGHDLAAATAREIYAVREKAAAFFGAGDVEEVVFTQNCTYALNTVLKGFLRPGDHVIVSDLEHNSVLRPVYRMASQGIITYSVAETHSDPEKTVSAFRGLIRQGTRAIICTHASNVFGVKLPVARLGALCRQYGLYFVLDAAQTAGIEPIDLKAMKIDFLCMAGHKSLYGPSGTGMLITPMGQCLSPLVEGGTGSISYDLAQPEFMPDRLESGTLNTSGIIGLGAGIDFINQLGMEKLAAQEMEVLQGIYKGLCSVKGVHLYTQEPTLESQVAVLSFNVEGVSAEETTKQLNQAGFALRGGLQCAPLAHKKFGTDQGGTVRASVGAFNTVEQGCALVKAVDAIARGCGISPAKKEK